MNIKPLALLGILLMAACAETSTEASVQDSIANVFPDPQDQAGIAVVVDGSGPVIFVVHYPDDVTDAEVLSRVQRYCAANGFRSAVPDRVRAGADLIQPDNSIRESRRGDYTCV